MVYGRSQHEFSSMDSLQALFHLGLGWSCSPLAGKAVSDIEYLFIAIRSGGYLLFVLATHNRFG
jgi:hypothetical protein